MRVGFVKKHIISVVGFIVVGLIAGLYIPISGVVSAATVPDTRYVASTNVAGQQNQSITYNSTITKAGTLSKIVFSLPAGTVRTANTQIFGNTGPATGSWSGNTLTWTVTTPYAVTVGLRPWVMVNGLTLPSGTVAGVTETIYGANNEILSQGTTASQTFSVPKVCPSTIPSSYISTENTKPGTPSWKLTTYDAARSSAYLSHSSARCGDTVNLYLKSNWYRMNVAIYRVGYYQGAGARQVFATNTGGYIRAIAQPNPLMVTTDEQGRTINMPTAKNWTTGFSFKIDGGFTPGAYLVKVFDDSGTGSYIPLVIRDDINYHDKTLLTSYATTAAYNNYGGASAYTTPIQSKRVSFDRPINLFQGAGMFMSLDYGFIYWAERQGFDMNYATDIDLHTRPLYDKTKTLILMAHTEYWSATMRDRVDTALTQSKNLASFGANQMYWRINPKPSTTTGADREYEIFRTAATETNTFRYATPTQPAKPEQSVLGSMFGCMHMDDQLVPNSTWLWQGVTDKTPLAHYFQGETDQVMAGFPVPAGSQLLGSSPLKACDVGANPARADVTAVIHPGGGRVFNASTHTWGCSLGGKCVYFTPTPLAMQQLSQATMNVFSWLDVRATGSAQNAFTTVPPR